MKNLLMMSMLDKDIKDVPDATLNTYNRVLENEYMTEDLVDIKNDMVEREKSMEDNINREYTLEYVLNTNANDPMCKKYLDTLSELSEMESAIMDNFYNRKVDFESEECRTFDQVKAVSESVNSLVKKFKEACKKEDVSDEVKMKAVDGGDMLTGGQDSEWKRVQGMPEF